MVQKSCFWVASHITGIFEILDQPDSILSKGSRGAGFCINRGVKTTVRINDGVKDAIFFDDNLIDTNKALVTMDVVRQFRQMGFNQPLEIRHYFEIPVSAGYGASAAGALGTAFSLNKLFNAELSELELFQMAHRAEVQNICGLGDIIGLYQGGLELRTSPGAPGVGRTQSLAQGDLLLATLSLGPISTATILTNPIYRRKIKEVGHEALESLVKKPTFSTFGKLAERFTYKIGLLSPSLKKLLDKVPSSVLKGQIMIGEGLFVLYEADSSFKELSALGFKKESICYKTVVEC